METEIESELNIVERKHGHPIEAIGTHRRGNRVARFSYSVLNGTLLHLITYIDTDSETFETVGSVYDLNADSTIGEGPWVGHEIEDFIENSFNAEPEAELEEVYEHVMEVDN